MEQELRIAHKNSTTDTNELNSIVHTHCSIFLLFVWLVLSSEMCTFQFDKLWTHHNFYLFKIDFLVRCDTLASTLKCFSLLVFVLIFLDFIYSTAVDVHWCTRTLKNKYIRCWVFTTQGLHWYRWLLLPISIRASRYTIRLWHHARVAFKAKTHFDLYRSRAYARTHSHIHTGAHARANTFK